MKFRAWVARLWKSFKITFLPQSVIDEATASWLSVGTGADGLDSNVVMAPVQWIMRTYPEAEPIVERRGGKAKPWKREYEHPIELLLREPNAFYDGDCMVQALALSYFMDGNAYLLKVRGNLEEVAELWYVPHWALEPMWPPDGSQFISYYRYAVNGRTIPVPPRNVVHLRFGLDPRNTRKGLSPLKAVLREALTDDEAAKFSAAILKNHGVPGLLISPSDGMTMSAEQVAEMRDYVKTKWRGDNRGDPFVAGAPTDVKEFGFDPNKLMLGNLRDISEERVCAMLGLPAAVVGFGAGLQATKVGATMRELRKLAWVQCITPSQNTMAKQMTRQLMPDFEELTTRYRIRFDTSGVSAFAEDENLTAERARLLANAGIITVADAQEMVGAEVDETQDVYLRPANLLAVRANEDGTAPAPTQDGNALDGLAAALASRAGLSGNGHGG